LGIKSIAERTEAVQADIAADAEPPALRSAGDGVAFAIEVGEKPTAKANDAPLCYSCGSKMQPAGSCYVCSSCGSTSGCS
jgi:ribonucleoside-diphosphate reductase alpha chain